MNGVTVEVSPVRASLTVGTVNAAVSTGSPVRVERHKKVQTYSGYMVVKSTTYRTSGVQLTVEKTGDYDISWYGWRSSSSGTNGSRLYINGVAHDAVHQAFVNVGQFVRLENVHLEAGDVLEVYARSRTASTLMTVGGLTIEEVIE